MELSRRNFLVGAASAGVLGAMAGLCAVEGALAARKEELAASELAAAVVRVG